MSLLMYQTLRMKKYVAIFLLILFAGRSFSQVDNSTSRTAIKADYLKKSKTQKTVAWVLAVTGTTLIVIGGSVGVHGAEDISLNDAATGGALIIAGTVMDLGSIPLFIAGAKNKRRAGLRQWGRGSRTASLYSGR